MEQSDLLGVWRLLGTTRKDEPVLSGQTHLVVHDDRLWEVWPDTTYYEGDRGPESSYEFEPGTPARLTIIVPRGRFCHLLQQRGDTLHVRLGGVFGRFPDSVDDDAGSLSRYVRETVPDVARKLREPPTRVKRPTTSHPVLGDLVYDGNLGWWESTVACDDERVPAYVSIDGRDDLASALDDAAAALAKLDCDAIKAYAAGELLELHNESWREDEGETTTEEFVAHMQLESLVFGSSGVSVSFADGGLFYGHMISVDLDRALVPKVADIAG